MTNFGIYVHVPFCQSKCVYCNFSSGVHSQDKQNQYFNKLTQEIQNFNYNGEISSVYFGGGTPSVVDEKHIVNTLNILKQKFKIKSSAEITIECNPNSVSKQKFEAYKKAGFNRISFGAQSFNDENLKFLGRKHKAEDIFNSVNLAKSVGFENISIDLLLGLKSNTENIENQLEKLKKMGLKHISAYMLIIEKNTPLHNIKDKRLLSDDKSVDQYEKLFKILKSLGFERYEVSNFAINGYESQHNLNYWKCGGYKGFGLSAHSYLENKRIANTNTLDSYLKAPTYSIEEITNEQHIEEKIMLGLRTKYGINLSELYKLGYNPPKDILSQLEEGRFIKINGDNLTVMPDKYGVLNQIILKLLC